MQPSSPLRTLLLHPLPDSLGALIFLQHRDVGVHTHPAPAAPLTGGAFLTVTGRAGHISCWAQRRIKMYTPYSKNRKKVVFFLVLSLNLSWCFLICYLRSHSHGHADTCLQATCRPRGSWESSPRWCAVFMHLSQPPPHVCPGPHRVALGGWAAENLSWKVAEGGT